MFETIHRFLVGLEFMWLIKIVEFDYRLTTMRSRKIMRYPKYREKMRDLVI